jgi:thiosulfate dehydrogenase (quinone) large subunit
MFQGLKSIQSEEVTQIPEPPIARFLFADKRMAWVWLIVRLYCGYEWLTAGWEKVFGVSISFGSFGEVTQSWIFGAHPGSAMQGFINGALSKAGGAQPGISGWYAWFLQNIVLPHTTLFSYLIAFGELFVGLGLIFGALTGIAAFCGLFMNINYLLAGSVSSNPILAMFAVLLILAWRIAGYYGLDRYLLPLLGTPWWPGSARKPRTPGKASRSSTATSPYVDSWLE